jgi:Protein of unknown function (DUF4007)
MMRISGTNVKPSFGGHEKFVFRDGWLKKGIDAVERDSMIFTEDNALVVLGVGKNMVRSIRHWCLATSLIEETNTPERKRAMRATALGKELMVNGGWDPFLEDTGTLWLLHWQLASNPVRSLIWHLTFSRFYETEFTKKQLGFFVEKQLERMAISTTSGMVEREIDCFLRMYAPTVKVNRISEESLDCPLAELDLIRFIPQDNVYRFTVGPKPTLPTKVFGYGLLQFLAGITQHRRTVAVDECVYHEGSPGQIFRLDENSVVEYLESLSDLTEGEIRFQETAGLQQLYINTEEASFFTQTATKLLGSYYDHR